MPISSTHSSLQHGLVSLSVPSSTQQTPVGFLPRLHAVPAYWSVVFEYTTTNVQADTHTHTEKKKRTKKEKEKEGGSSASILDVNQIPIHVGTLKCFIEPEDTAGFNYSDTLH